MIWNFSSLMSISSRAQNRQGQEHHILVTNFTVNCTDKKKIFIYWATENSISTNYSEIQKNTDNNFKTIAFVLGPNPKRPDYHHYGCFDKFVQKIARHSYYKFKHIDNTGLEEMIEANLMNKL